MANFAPPVRRGDFLYTSVLYADPRNDNSPPRSSAAELAALVRPEAPNLYSNGRKPDVSALAKDWLRHFYHAQLIHYGLPVTRDRSRAKTSWLDAMNQFKLCAKISSANYAVLLDHTLACIIGFWFCRSLKI